MKTLILGILCTIALTSTSCSNTRNVEDVTDKTEIPVTITQKMKTDTSMDAKILEANKKLYVIQHSKDGVYVSKVIKKEGREEEAFFMGIICVLILALLLGLLADR